MGIFQPEVFIEGLTGVPYHFYLLGFLLVFVGLIASNNPAILIVTIPLMILLSLMGHMIKLGEERDVWSSLAEGNRYIIEMYQSCREPGLFQEGSKLECSELLIQRSTRNEFLDEEEMKQLIDYWEENLSLRSRLNSKKTRIELNDNMTKNERLSVLTGQSVEDLEEADQRLIEKGLLIPSKDQQGEK
jgi:hypothetical protein